MLPQEQIPQIKKQIISQIERDFPQDKKASAIQQIEAMTAEQLESFLIKNNLIKQGQTPSPQQQGTQCVFCSIASEQVQSYKIDENKDSIAVLEINPISKAHSLVIPKKHLKSSDKIPQTAFSLAKSVAKKIKTKLKPKDVEISSANLFGHEIINILPIYENENINSQRQQSNPEELEELKAKLEKKSKPKTIKKPKPKKIEEKIWLPKRIP